MRRLALVAVLAIAACEAKEHEPLDLSSLLSPEPPASPTPTPLREGEYRLAIAGIALEGTAGAMTVDTSASCALRLPRSVILAGERGWYQVTGPAITDAQGSFDGVTLALEGNQRRSRRPTVDCVVDVRQTWTLLRSTPDGDELAGSFVESRSVAEGHACREALPCEERRDATLTFVAERSRPLLSREPTPEPTPEPSPSPVPTKAKTKAKKKKPTP